MRTDGNDRTIWSPRQARKLGLGMVHQHFTSIPALTVAENIALAAGWAGPPGQLCRKAESLSEKLGLPLDPDQRAGRLPVALKQRLEIVKALAVDAKICYWMSPPLCWRHQRQMNYLVSFGDLRRPGAASF